MRRVVSMICEVATRACLSMSLCVSLCCHNYYSRLLCWSLWITTLDGSLLCSPYLHFACSLLYSPILPIQHPAHPNPHRKWFMVGIGSGTFLHWSSFNVMVLINYLLRAVVVSSAWHAHMVHHSHGCTGWRSCSFSCAASHSWLVSPIPTTCQCDRCLDSWHGGSWLGCRDLQPRECHLVQGLAGRLPAEALGHPKYPTSIMIGTSPLLLYKFVLTGMRTTPLTREKQGGFYQNKVNPSLTFIQRPGI